MGKGEAGAVRGSPVGEGVMTLHPRPGLPADAPPARPDTGEITAAVVELGRRSGPVISHRSGERGPPPAPRPRARASHASPPR